MENDLAFYHRLLNIPIMRCSFPVVSFTKPSNTVPVLLVICEGRFEVSLQRSLIVDIYFSNTFLAHQTTVCVEPTTQTVVALGVVTGGSTTSLSFILAAGAAATNLVKKRTASNIHGRVVILEVMYDVVLVVGRYGSLTSRGTSRRNSTCDPDAALCWSFNSYFSTVTKPEIIMMIMAVFKLLFLVQSLSSPPALSRQTRLIRTTYEHRLCFQPPSNSPKTHHRIMAATSAKPFGEHLPVSTEAWTPNFASEYVLGPSGQNCCVIGRTAWPR